MKALCIAAATILLVIPAMVSAQSAATASAQKEKKVCKTERVTGSLTRRTRICLTEAEWARMSENTRKNVDGLADDGHRTTLEGRLGSQAGPDGGANGW